MFHLECSQVCRTLSTHEQLYRAAVDIEAQKAHREHLENARLADLGFLELKQALQLKGCSKLKVDANVLIVFGLGGEAVNWRGGVRLC